jgi:hypothetical protein
MTMLALVIKTRFEDSNKKCFRISAFEIVFEILLQYFEVVHKKFVSHFFNESDLGVWGNVISLKFFKFAYTQTVDPTGMRTKLKYPL